MSLVVQNLCTGTVSQALCSLLQRPRAHQSPVRGGKLHRPARSLATDSWSNSMAFAASAVKATAWHRGTLHCTTSGRRHFRGGASVVSSLAPSLSHWHTRYFMDYPGSCQARPTLSALFLGNRCSLFACILLSTVGSRTLVLYYPLGLSHRLSPAIDLPQTGRDSWLA